jgi:hypothetical protein
MSPIVFYAGEPVCRAESPVELAEHLWHHPESLVLTSAVKAETLADFAAVRVLTQLPIVPSWCVNRLLAVNARR